MRVMSAAEGREKPTSNTIQGLWTGMQRDQDAIVAGLLELGIGKGSFFFFQKPSELSMV